MGSVTKYDGCKPLGGPGFTFGLFLDNPFANWFGTNLIPELFPRSPFSVVTVNCPGVDTVALFNFTNPTNKNL